MIAAVDAGLTFVAVGVGWITVVVGATLTKVGIGEAAVGVGAILVAVGGSWVAVGVGGTLVGLGTGCIVAYTGTTAAVAGCDTTVFAVDGAQAASIAPAATNVAIAKNIMPMVRLARYLAVCMMASLKSFPSRGQSARAAWQEKLSFFVRVVSTEADCPFDAKRL